MQNLTRADIAKAIQDNFDISKQDADKIVASFIQVIVSSLQEGRRVELRGFGSLRVKTRGSRVGRNPKTGDPVEVPPKKVVAFKMGKEFRTGLVGKTIPED